MSTIEVSAIKTTPGCKTGLSLAARGGKVIITNVAPTGLFGFCNIPPDCNLLTINGVSIANMTLEKIKSALISFPRKVTIVVQENGENCLSLPYHAPGSQVDLELRHRDDVPALLVCHDVPLAKWHRIYEYFVQEFCPQALDSAKLHQGLQIQLKGYVDNQMKKGVLGFGLADGHEKKVHEMVHQACSLADTAVLAVTSLLVMANALLNPHGIFAQPCYHKRILPYSDKQTDTFTYRTPIGLSFLSIAHE